MLELSQLLIEQDYLPILLLHHLKELDTSSSPGAPHAFSSILISQLQIVLGPELTTLSTVEFAVLYTIKFSNAVVQIIKSL